MLGSRASKDRAILRLIEAANQMRRLGAGLLMVSNVGLAVLAAGSFFAQAIATGFVGRTATFERAAADGLYLSTFYFGGLAAAAVAGARFMTVLAGIVAENVLALTIAWWLAKGAHARRLPKRCAFGASKVRSRLSRRTSQKTCDRFTTSSFRNWHVLLVVPTMRPGWVEGSRRGVAKPRLTFRYFDFAASSGESDTGIV
jgi:hypothetical protein